MKLKIIFLTILTLLFQLVLSQPLNNGTAPYAFDVLQGSIRPGGINKSQKNEYVPLAAGATGTILNYSGQPGVLDTFGFQFYEATGSDNNDFNNSVLTITIDGTVTVQMPTVDFFQAHYLIGGSASTQFPSFSNAMFVCTMPATESNGQGSFECHIPMPFSNSIKITVTNGAASLTATFWSMAKFQVGLPNIWNGTRKFWAKETIFNSSHTNYNQAENYLNIAPGTGGRYLGIYWMADDFANGSGMHDYEGNWRIYTDCFNSTWVASTAYILGQTILDSNGNIQTVTTPGTSGSSVPTWNQTKSTTSDGSVTWTETPGDATTVWIASATYVATYHSIVDPNGNLQVVTTAGTVGSTQPTWNTTVGGTTTDNTVTWTNYGPSFQSAGYNASGTEDYFNLGFYFGNASASQSSPLYPIGFTGASDFTGLTFYKANVTAAPYRWHIKDPIRFNNSIAILRQYGDTSQATLTTGYDAIWCVVYYYTG